MISWTWTVLSTFFVALLLAPYVQAPLQNRWLSSQQSTETFDPLIVKQHLWLKICCRLLQRLVWAGLGGGQVYMCTAGFMRAPTHVAIWSHIAYMHQAEWQAVCYKHAVGLFLYGSKLKHHYNCLRMLFRVSTSNIWTVRRNANTALLSADSCGKNMRIDGVFFRFIFSLWWDWLSHRSFSFSGTRKRIKRAACPN